MRMATFNILHGRSVHDGSVELDRLADSIKRLDADIVALQEVDLDQPRSGKADLTAVAAEAMGAVSHRFVAAISGTPGATWMAATGREQPGTAAYGIALLSRYLAESWQVVHLPRIPVRFPMYLPGPRRVQVVHEEPRAAMVARIDTPLGPLTVANTHLSFVPGWNVRQLQLVRRALRRMPAPRVLLADLNLPGRLPRLFSGWHRLAGLPTYPSPAPRVQFDHVLADRRGLERLPRVLGADTPAVPFSDHRPLIVTLRDRPGTLEID